MRKYFDYFLILLIFAITGSTAAWVGKPLLSLFNITKESAGSVLYYLLYFIVITPIYQVLLLEYAWLFGKYTYFVEKQTRLYRRLFKQPINSQDNRY